MTRRSAVPIEEIRGELDRVNGATAPTSPPQHTLAKLAKLDRLAKLAKLTPTLAQIEGEELVWDWTDRIPSGKIFTIEGPPGVGKSTVMLDLISRRSKGWAMPFDDASPRPPATALILSNEDGVADTIKWRCIAAGADQGVVIPIPAQVDGEDVNLGSIDVLRTYFNEHRPWLLVVDGLDSYWPTTMKGHQASDIRRALGPVSLLAQEYGVDVGLIRHINKRLDGMSAMHAGLGGVSIIGTARAGHLALRDPIDKTLITMASIKHNLSDEPPSLEYRIVPVTVTNPKTGGEVHTTRIDWLRTSTRTGDDLIARVQSEVLDRAGNASASDWLVDYLASGARPKEDAIAEGKIAGFSSRQIERAAGKVAISKKPLGGKASWSLPQSRQSDQLRQSDQSPHVAKLEKTTELDTFDESPETFIRNQRRIHARPRTD